MGDSTFAKVENTRLKVSYGWMLVVDSEHALDAYDDRFNQLVDKGGRDVFSGGHATTPFGCFVETFYRESVLTRAELLAIFVRNVRVARREAFQKYGKLFINRSGGFFPYGKDVRILSTRVSNRWPDDLCLANIRILSWPKGTHYYAKVGDRDVRFRGKSKWDSYDEAHAAAVAFVKKERKKNQDIS